MTSDKNSVNEVGITKMRNKAKKNDLETYGHNMDPKTPAAIKRSQNAMDKAKRDKSGAIKRATFRQSQIESIVLEGLVKKMNKAKKNASMGSGDGPEALKANRDSNKNNITPNSKAATGHAELALAQTMRRAGNKRLSKAVLQGSKANREAAKKHEALERVIIEVLNEKRDFNSRGPGAFKRSEIKSGLNKEEPGSGDNYIKVAAEKRAKSNAALSSKDDRSKAAATVQSTASKLDAEPNSKGKITKGAFRKAVTGSASTGKFTSGGLKPGASGEDGRLNSPASKVTNTPKKGPSNFKKGPSEAPLSKDKINQSGVAGKPGEAASKDKMDKLKNVPAFDKQAARRKMLAAKVASMRGK